MSGTKPQPPHRASRASCKEQQGFAGVQLLAGLQTCEEEEEEEEHFLQDVAIRRGTMERSPALCWLGLAGWRGELNPRRFPSIGTPI
jgi:hypothetical protein